MTTAIDAKLTMIVARIEDLKDAVWINQMPGSGKTQPLSFTMALVNQSRTDQEMVFS